MKKLQPNKMAQKNIDSKLKNISTCQMLKFFYLKKKVENMSYFPSHSQLCSSMCLLDKIPINYIEVCDHNMTMCMFKGYGNLCKTLYQCHH